MDSPDAFARGRGFTLPELLLLIVVLAIGMAGILTVYVNTVAASADPLVRKQAMAIAESLMEEIMLQAYSAGTAPAAGATRATFDEVGDYQGYSTAGGIVNIYGIAVAGLGNYNVSPVQVEDVTLNSVSEAKRVTVTVTAPHGEPFSLQGYKLNYP
jgi:MSHA pilin protein MshD